MSRGRNLTLSICFTLIGVAILVAFFSSYGDPAGQTAAERRHSDHVASVGMTIAGVMLVPGTAGVITVHLLERRDRRHTLSDRNLPRS